MFATPGVAIIALFVVLLTIRRFSQALSSPLNAARDAHWSVKFSGVWIWWQQIRERDAQAVHDAHVRLGPVVRLGPREISVNDVDGGLKLIYDGRLPKTDFYQAANSYGEEPMVALKDEESHRERIRMLAKPYGKSYLRSHADWHAEQAKLIEDLVSGVNKHIEKNSIVEFYDVFFAWSVATISTYVFGAPAALNLLNDFPKAAAVRERYFSQRMYLFIAAVVPGLATVVGWMGYVPEVSFIREMQDRAESSSKSYKKQTHEGDRTTPYDYMKQAMEGSNSKEPANEASKLTRQPAILLSEMNDHIVAGIDTSAASLVASAYALSLQHNQHWQGKLREEIRASRQSTPEEDLESLPILNAIIKETLRLYPPVAGGQPRITDKAIVIGPTGHEVTLPPGITVHCQAQSLHGSNIFVEPKSFKPERWLKCTVEERKEMDRWFWAFGSGSRGCIGKHLAMDNLGAAVAAIWENFETEVTDDTTLALSRGMLAMPLPDKGGNYARLHVRKVM